MKRANLGVLPPGLTVVYDLFGPRASPAGVQSKKTVWLFCASLDVLVLMAACEPTLFSVEPLLTRNVA